MLSRAQAGQPDGGEKCGLAIRLSGLMLASVC